MKILVFMSDNRKPIGEIYYSYTASINFEYCKKHGYDFKYYVPYYKDQTPTLYNCVDPNTSEPRHAAWSKLLSAKLALTLKYDYVVYIDSDCIFRDFNISLEKFIEQNQGSDFIFTNDQPHNPYKPNSGFFVSKVNERTLKNIHDWFHYSLPEHNNQHAYEQDALWKIMNTFDITLVDMWVFFERKEFMRHISNFDNGQRLPYFKKFTDMQNIDVRKNTETILNNHVVEYDTSAMFVWTKLQKKIE